MRNRIIGIISGLIIMLSARGLLRLTTRELSVVKAIPELRVRLTGSTRIPDPARIESTGDWYYLDHVSSGLTAYDSRAQKFVPRFAASWETRQDGTHLFHLRSGIQFHDGTPITARDILWTLKRQLLLKTSTHFPLWEYIEGCDSLHSLDQECAGLRAESPQTIAIRLKGQSHSFFLQLASPETGIWAASDMDPNNGDLKPTRFSGPYFIGHLDEESALMMRNPHSPISQEFKNSPRSIRIKSIPLIGIDDALAAREVDLVVRPHSPLGERDWNALRIEIRATTPSQIIYLFGLGKGARPAVGQDWLEQAWKNTKDPVLSPSDTFLPFAKNYGLRREEFLSQLPKHTSKRLRIFCPIHFFSDAFLEQLKEAGRAVGSEIDYFFAPPDEWFQAFHDPNASAKYDYILSSYAASERYPAVQLRYLTKRLLTPPIDLKEAEIPDLSAHSIEILKSYQKWLLNARQAIPIYFNRTYFLHQSNIDLGDQPQTDAEIELWRVQEKTAHAK